jgi:hypothetical protein
VGRPWGRSVRVYEGFKIVGRILLGVVIGVILVIWLFTACVGAIF